MTDERCKEDAPRTVCRWGAEKWMDKRTLVNGYHPECWRQCRCARMHMPDGHCADTPKEGQQ